MVFPGYWLLALAAFYALGAWAMYKYAVSQTEKGEEDDDLDMVANPRWFSLRRWWLALRVFRGKL